MSDKSHGYDVNVAINAVRRQLYVDYNIPASEQEPDMGTLPAPCGYKARPLVGVWATPPFLHNGSVRTIRQLLSDTRDASFAVGSREYDTVDLGYINDPGALGMTLDTSILGNLNTGHWWTDDMSRPGRIGPKLADADISALLEYLKGATYADYPTENTTTPLPLACADDRDWASK
jgi:hypothetical protein